MSRLSLYQTNKRSDYILAMLALGIALFGLTMISSASAVISYERFNHTSYYVVRQAIAFLVGVLVMIVFAQIPYRFWRRMSVSFMIVILILLVAVFIPGVGIKLGGAHRWISFGPLLVQPSELAKLSLVIYLASWFEQKGRKVITDFQKGLAPFLTILLLVVLLIMKQPDLGTVVVIGLTAASMFFLAGASLAQMVSVAVVAMTAFLIFIRSASYRWIRFLTFLHPASDIQGAGYQINQSLIAIGSGGLFGLGFGLSRQKYLYLPQPHIDSIFAIMTEELGFIRISIFLLIFLVFIIRCFRIAKKAPDEFGQLLGAGIALWILFQFFVNIAAVTHIVPLTGVPLPLISYGGSALVSLMAGIGILLNISKS